jgi:hypothetical protein
VNAMLIVAAIVIGVAWVYQGFKAANWVGRHSPGARRHEDPP